MTETDELHVVIGASGATGRVVVRELVAKGKRVRAVNRGGCADVPDGVEVLAGDAPGPNRLREVCRSAVVVYHCAMRLFVGGSSYSIHLAGLRGLHPSARRGFVRVTFEEAGRFPNAGARSATSVRYRVERYRGHSAGRYSLRA